MEATSRLDSFINLGLIFAILIVVSLGCGGAPYTVPNAEYLGVWSGDGATLTILPGGIAEYSSPTLYLRENDVRIYDTEGKSFTLGDYEYKFKIDSEPKDNVMSLNGKTYQKIGNGEPLPPPSDKLKIPSDSEIETMIKDTIGEYIKALEAGNPGQFLAKFSKEIDDYDKSLFQENFAKALKNKDKSLISLRDAQTKQIKFDRKPNMAFTTQGGKIRFNESSYASQPFGTFVQGDFDFKNGKSQISSFWVRLE